MRVLRKKKKSVIKKYNTIALFVLLWGMVGVSFWIVQQRTDIFGNAVGKWKINPTPTPFATYTPMTVTSDSLQGGWTQDTICTDSTYTWSVRGSLNAGESYTFTPSKPNCSNGENSYISAEARWDSSKIELSTDVPIIKSGTVTKGPHVVGIDIGNSAQLCMWPVSGYQAPATFTYSYTVKNIGTTTAYNVTFNGNNQNTWPLFYYNHCMQSDADHDGFNDSLEYEMYQLGQNVTYESFPASAGISLGIDEINKWLGSKYLASSGTAAADDEEDYYPPDFNDDGYVNQLDVDRMILWIGKGNGLPLAEISANPSDPEYYYNQTLAWRRFDLNGDGYVNQTDISIVNALKGPDPVPNIASTTSGTDILAPTVIFSGLADGAAITKGSQFIIPEYAWDNQALTKVETYINGTLACSQSIPNFVGRNAGLPIVPLYSCPWNVPKRAASYALSAKAFDAAGNTSIIPTITVYSQ